jgi:uncharacterized FAD-dependent dehydrogenase
MQKIISLRLLPAEAIDEQFIKEAIAKAESLNPATVKGYTIIKHSIDARGKQAWIQLSVNAFINEPFQQRPLTNFHFKDVTAASRKVIIVGGGPAGLFAALKFLEAGIKPIVLERGKNVKDRRRDLAALNRMGIVNPESNYCFGEGGAGTYSDGKLYTRSSKRGDINRILQLFVFFGAEEKILYESHPHIGTNKLPNIITKMREQIIACGGEFLFEKKVTKFIIDNQKISSVITADQNRFDGDAVILATGHSARDIFHLLHDSNILVEAKPFALGVRIEHPQALIDCAQYHIPLSHPNPDNYRDCERDHLLPPASYNLVEQVDGKGVFSFCMCPGGIIAPAATAPGELVVNGWSPSKRNNPFANSGMVVTVSLEEDSRSISKFTNLEISKLASDPLALLKFQQKVEQKAFEAGGGALVAPAQRMVDFTNNKLSSTLPDCSYLPGLKAVGLDSVLPSFIYKRLQEAFKEFGKKMKGYYTNDAVVVATESRTSSPVRIPRHNTSLQHPQIQNLYPCGEGAGYAGGIVSAAMDGERVADIISVVL